MHLKANSVTGLLLFILMSFALLCSGCAADNSDAGTTPTTEPTIGTQATEPVQLLNINATSGNEIAGGRFKSEEIGGNFSQGLCYSNCRDVTIQLDCLVLPLEEALRDGWISEDEIFYYARQDAKNGFCEETSESHLGLTYFTYRYGDLYIVLVNDIFETPDDRQVMIRWMDIHGPNYFVVPQKFRDENGYLATEDWGLSFEVSEATPTGATVICTQTESQQTGRLVVTGISLNVRSGSDADEWTKLDRPDDTNVFQEFATLNLNSTTEIKIDWREIYGELPSGEYRLGMIIRDICDPAPLHPLLPDYQEVQWPYVYFTIP